MLLQFDLPAPITVARRYSTRRIAFTADGILAVLNLAEPQTLATQEKIVNTIDPEPMIMALVATGKATRTEACQALERRSAPSCPACWYCGSGSEPAPPCARYKDPRLASRQHRFGSTPSRLPRAAPRSRWPEPKCPPEQRAIGPSASVSSSLSGANESVGLQAPQSDGVALVSGGWRWLI